MTRDHQKPPPRSRSISRRAFLWRSAGATLALTAGGTLLEACGGGKTRERLAKSGPLLASPSNPVKWPIYSDNPPIAAGMQPERNATLKLYNWADYIYKKVVQDFEKKYKQYGVKVQISTFNNMDEALAKIRAGTVDFDVFFPTYDVLGKLIQAKYLRPLTQSYVPNIDQVWEVFQNPFYDQGWQYSVPYTVYTTGIAWRVDKVSDDIAKLPNPYDVFWDQRFKGKVEILDDYREAMSMVLLRNGVTDLNTGDPAKINMVRDQLVDLAKTIRPAVSTNDYVDLPEAKVWVTQSWSGDMVNAQYYMPKGQSAGVMRYWFPPDGKGAVGNDLIALLRTGKNPVLGHLFLNWMLDSDVAIENMGWNGYQPPLRSINPTELVSQELVPKNLATATVLPEYFDKGYRQLELSPAVDNLWHDAWQQFKAGA
jgi:spermidine/putrescine transport system substrate-binding protein